MQNYTFFLYFQTKWQKKFYPKQMPAHHYCAGICYIWDIIYVTSLCIAEPSLLFVIRLFLQYLVSSL